MRVNYSLNGNLQLYAVGYDITISSCDSKAGSTSEVEV